MEKLEKQCANVRRKTCFGGRFCNNNVYVVLNGAEAEKVPTAAGELLITILNKVRKSAGSVQKSGNPNIILVQNRENLPKNCKEFVLWNQESLAMNSSLKLDKLMKWFDRVDVLEPFVEVDGVLINCYGPYQEFMNFDLNGHEKHHKNIESSLHQILENISIKFTHFQLLVRCVIYSQHCEYCLEHLLNSLDSLEKVKRLLNLISRGVWSPIEKKDMDLVEWKDEKDQKYKVSCWRMRPNAQLKVPPKSSSPSAPSSSSSPSTSNAPIRKPTKNLADWHVKTLRNVLDILARDHDKLGEVEDYRAIKISKDEQIELKTLILNIHRWLIFDQLDSFSEKSLGRFGFDTGEEKLDGELETLIKKLFVDPNIELNVEKIIISMKEEFYGMFKRHISSNDSKYQMISRIERQSFLTLEGKSSDFPIPKPSKKRKRVIFSTDEEEEDEVEEEERGEEEEGGGSSSKSEQPVEEFSNDESEFEEEESEGDISADCDKDSPIDMERKRKMAKTITKTVYTSIYSDLSSSSSESSPFSESPPSSPSMKKYDKSTRRARRSGVPVFLNERNEPIEEEKKEEEKEEEKEKIVEPAKRKRGRPPKRKPSVQKKKQKRDGKKQKNVSSSEEDSSDDERVMTPSPSPPPPPTARRLTNCETPSSPSSPDSQHQSNHQPLQLDEKDDEDIIVMDETTSRQWTPNPIRNRRQIAPSASPKLAEEVREDEYRGNNQLLNDQKNDEMDSAKEDNNRPNTPANHDSDDDDEIVFLEKVPKKIIPKSQTIPFSSARHVIMHHANMPSTSTVGHSRVPETISPSPITDLVNKKREEEIVSSPNTSGENAADVDVPIPYDDSDPNFSMKTPTPTPSLQEIVNGKGAKSTKNYETPVNFNFDSIPLPPTPTSPGEPMDFDVISSIPLPPPSTPSVKDFEVLSKTAATSPTTPSACSTLNLSQNTSFNFLDMEEDKKEKIKKDDDEAVVEKKFDSGAPCTSTSSEVSKKEAEVVEKAEEEDDDEEIQFLGISESTSARPATPEVIDLEDDDDDDDDELAMRPINPESSCGIQ